MKLSLPRSPVHSKNWALSLLDGGYLSQEPFYPTLQGPSGANAALPVVDGALSHLQEFAEFLLSQSGLHPVLPDFFSQRFRVLWNGFGRSKGTSMVQVWRGRPDRSGPSKTCSFAGQLSAHSEKVNTSLPVWLQFRPAEGVPLHGADDPEVYGEGLGAPPGPH